MNMAETDNYNHIRELFDEKLKPIVQAMAELRQEVKEMNYSKLELKVEELEKSKEYYKVEYLNTVKRLDAAEVRINKLEFGTNDISKINGILNAIDKHSNKLEEFEAILEKHEATNSIEIASIKADQSTTRKEMGLFLFAARYPKVTIGAIVAILAIFFGVKAVDLIKHLFMFL